ncbi:MAG: ABC transporter permease [Candidatus Pseudobacter hemicellulosilyticus]|uniref:ABC transporter permease n=1 Tax=Candidatus Pseudobacter hemicellulosilyticus TaxID=3121375 RepID=A0AAJ6BH58_9BACT|nr:MAG: ABC transporter permease [Pseudobacter sp.]
MFKSYVKVAWRNLLKNKGFTFINISGLAIGLATCLLIVLYVMDELSYDRFHTKADRIYRVDPSIRFSDNTYELAVAAPSMAEAMVRDYPQVEAAVRFRNYGGWLVKRGADNIREEKVIFADASLFSVFSLNMLNGNPATALKEPGTLVLTESMARKYFNRTDVVGESLTVGDHEQYRITGVIRDMPAQSHFQFDFFASLAGSREAKENNWLSHNFNTYILLREGADPALLTEQMKTLVTRYANPQVESIMQANLDELEKAGSYIRYNLMPLTRIHLHSARTAELGPNNNIQYIWIFSAVALFILLIACVNFMNLSTARSAERAREVGVRKALGSRRHSLIKQFLTESMLVSFLSTILALVLAWLLLPLFNQLAAKSISHTRLSEPLILCLVAGIMLVVGLLAGSYPAFYLSAFRPIQVLKGKLQSGFGGSLRNGLVVFQFGISIFLIAGTVVIFNQMKYIREKNIGYNRQQVLVVKNGYVLKQPQAFRESVLTLPGVEHATITGYLPTSNYRNDNLHYASPTLEPHSSMTMQAWMVDEHYLPTLGIQLLKGRNFSAEFPADSQGVLLNESAARLFGREDPVNKKLYFLNSMTSKSLSGFTVLGVFKDFNFNSLRQQVSPMALYLHEERGSIAFRINTADIKPLVRQIESRWKAMAPGQPFQYSFMDEDFDAQYRAEQRTGSLSLTFSILAILIACLGLFGLAAYAAEQRTKEIGIRKVLGASANQLMIMLSKDFLKLVLLAALIAFPLAWWAMNSWLQSFHYRVGIAWWVFAFTGCTTLLIALFTVSWQALKAALANPVKSLRSE